MISDYLDRELVLKETRAQRDALLDLQNNILPRTIAALNDALARALKDKKHPQGAPYIPSDPVTCGLQTGLSRIAIESGLVQTNTQDIAPSSSRGRVRGRVASKRAAKSAGGKVIDTSPALRLRSRPSKAAARTRGAARASKAAFVEGSDPLYALDGFKAKFGGLFSSRRAFNKNPARIAASKKSLSLFLFGDWGTGLDLAQQVTKRIGEQLQIIDASRQPHVIHLGDVYYVGEPEEYEKRLLPYWPVTSAQRDAIGSWSINGNHDMYSSGEGYFDTLLRQDIMIRWHGDKDGEPSSFFLIEDPDWQVFGLDTSWKLPSLASTIFGKPTKEDYGGQNGVLTEEQVVWMAKVRDSSKGCILLTHHQPGSSRSGDDQHSKEAVKLMKSKGVYSQLDAWIWGHEHRCVVFKPKAERTTPALMDAPDFCVCLGHGGVPVTKKNFAADKKLPDVLWEEDRLNATSPIYEGDRVVPFGFGRIDTKPGAFEFRVFDHTGAQCYVCQVTRSTTHAPSRGALKRGGKAPVRSKAKK